MTEPIDVELLLLLIALINIRKVFPEAELIE